MDVFIRTLQDTICTALESEDSASFREDTWQRPEGGGGRSRVLEGGATIEKGGVNISRIHGEMSEELAQQLRAERTPFAVCGLSLVIHPRSPRVPTTHMNVRYFETDAGRSWFGGGIDLTPYYPHLEDFRQFHQVLKDTCEGVRCGSYDGYKTWCDEYFTIRHRQEMRGIGGIFFDDLDGNDPVNFALVQAVGEAFLTAYLPMLQARKDEPFTEADRQFQLVRRGRYIEFNLVYDRGTLFGLKSNGRIESIFMSLPPVVHYPYDWHPEPGSPHTDMIQYYQPQIWA
ncbi:MAG: oxygen-dependent coproporphyrinogen oxidase [Deltaproteobacteria bacterium]|jgi:coproporphyrinogen III oxidase|nr:oxygen-dependent coproporphyrinogen oxidase [Deltaproteobacteria bacterium]MDP7158393.1 oxygen-dependent coproporphyrinogen oxidase [SAR324 cluster bacterium]MDP7318514.1 oxygen-dependent coproporphyrinogen oxidase [SAR324 cluster bacterium]MDP7629183.1 oxygen-dependent coproporphyrinogen oxidase [SAR324 cluster bacterium]